ncbi:MAG: outer membrane beta-barrel protein [Rhodospirillales bacterium]
MRAVKQLAVFSLASLAMSGTALAADRPTGPYIGGAAGANFAGDNNLSGRGIDTDISHDTGFVGVLSLGQAFANGFRGEIELGKRRNSIDKSGTTSTGGRSSVLSGMINGYYDFATGTAFMPYLGAGIGVGQLSMDVSPVGTGRVHSSGRGLGLQGIAGVGYQIDDNWTGSVEYRYYNLQGADVNVSGVGSIDADYDSHAVMVGLRYTFGEEKKPMAQAAPAPAPKPVAQKQPEPKPAPAPAAPPPVARNYIVFFDWNKDDISFEALEILKSAAENARKGNISRIQATGHADTSGTRAYNTKLSERRARAVQATLNSLGIASNEITVEAKGEQDPLVPTADGVREPQNRRVEIVFP